MKPHWTKASVWSHQLTNYTFATEFVPLSEDDRKQLAAGNIDAPEVKQIINRIDSARAKIDNKWNVFAFADCIAPTDTERFQKRRGAIASAKSIWTTLCLSEKVRNAASAGDVEFIAIRPFRFMTYQREFRLFIFNGQLSAMSQLRLDRHYKRFADKSIQAKLFNRAKDLVAEVIDKLPTKTLVMDIYFTQMLMPMIIDLNEFGTPTDPLLMKTWDTDWNIEHGIKLIPSPTKISGDVNVTF